MECVPYVVSHAPYPWNPSRRRLPPKSSLNQIRYLSVLWLKLVIKPLTESCISDPTVALLWWSYFVCWHKSCKILKCETNSKIFVFSLSIVHISQKHLLAGIGTSSLKEFANHAYNKHLFLFNSVPKIQVTLDDSATISEYNENK